MKLKYNKQYIPVSLPSPESNPIVVQNESTVKSNGMKWGQPTWFFLHTLAEKVNENKFPEIRKELLEIIYNICELIINYMFIIFDK